MSLTPQAEERKKFDIRIRPSKLIYQIYTSPKQDVQKLRNIFQDQSLNKDLLSEMMKTTYQDMMIHKKITLKPLLDRKFFKKEVLNNRDVVYFKNDDQYQAYSDRFGLQYNYNSTLFSKVQPKQQDYFKENSLKKNLKQVFFVERKHFQPKINTSPFQ